VLTEQAEKTESHLRRRRPRRRGHRPGHEGSLEFDGIVVVEPGEIEAESPAGRATLYVVYTRATQQMVTVSRG
jgi:hypothetical protein